MTSRRGMLVVALQNFISYDVFQLSHISFIIDLIKNNYVNIIIFFIISIIIVDRYSYYLKINKSKKRKSKSRKLPKSEPLFRFNPPKWKIFFLLISLAGVLMIKSAHQPEKITGLVILAFGLLGFFSELAGIELYDSAIIAPRRYEYIPYFLAFGRVRIRAREIDFVGIKRSMLYGHTIIVQPFDKAAFSTLVISCLNDEETVRIMECLLAPPLRLNTHRNEPSIYKY